MKIGIAMNAAHVEQRNDAYMVAGTRVSLDSIVYSFQAGQSAEAIAQAFPVLSLDQVVFFKQTRGPRGAHRWLKLSCRATPRAA